MARICFVCNEIFPTTPGGAGSLIYQLAQTLLTEGQEVLFLLDISKEDFNRFDRSDRLNLPNHEKCRAYHAEALCKAMPYREHDFLSRYLWEAFRYDFAGRQVYDLEKPDIIEFVDFCGPAYYALCAKIAGLSYQISRIVIRIHGLIELIDRSSRVKPLDFDRYTLYALERYSLRMAETVLYPTPSFLREYSNIEHEPWLGEAVLAEPVIATYTKRDQEDPGANIALFYGRLFSVKGADEFVEAAVLTLAEKPGSKLEFYLVGYDSMHPPISGPRSYQEYLLKKIPERYRSRFTFTGFLNREQLEKLLPRVKLAVFPSHYETYCFAAHEIRLAGIPLIVSDIPAFRDHFRPERDAIFFDGSVSDLAKQIHRLDDDESLRTTLAQPSFKEAGDSIGFYRNPWQASWIKPKSELIQTSILICILMDEAREGFLARTLGSLAEANIEKMRVLLLKECNGEEALVSATWLFGRWYEFYDQASQRVSPVDIRTSQALLILRAGDQLTPEFIAVCLGILSRQPQISYIGSWKWIGEAGRKWLYTHPLAAMLELAPLETLSAFNRCVMRTPPGLLLVDLFDRKADTLAEAAYLWKLDNEQTFGVQIPSALIWQPAEILISLGTGALSYLVLQDRSATRHSHLTRYLTMLVNAFPRPVLPLQAYWAEKSGHPPFSSSGSTQSMIVRPNWRGRLTRRLNGGGAFGMRLLGMLRWLWSKVKVVR